MRRLFSPQSAHDQRQLRETSLWTPDGERRRAAERVGRFDDEPGLSGDAAYTVNEKGIILRTSQDRAIQVLTADGKRQFTFGTEDVALGGEPYVTIGEDLDTAGWRIRLHGRKGHISALAGFLQMATHNFGKAASGVRAVGDGSNAVAWGTTWTFDAPAAGSTTTGRWSLYTTAATTGSARGPNGPLDFLSPWEVESLFRIQMGANIDNVRVWIGLFSGDPSGSSTPNLHFAGFRYVGGAETTWKAYTGDGTARTQTDTTIAVTANQLYALRVRLFATEAHMIVGQPEITLGAMSGDYTVIHTTNLPATTQLLGAYVRVTTLENVAKSLKFGLANFLSW